MTLDELVDLCAGSDAEDWAPVLEGPMFLAGLGQGGTADEGRAEVFGSHRRRATYRPDVSVGLAWGFRVDDEWEERTSPDWVLAAHIPDPSATQCYLDLLYNGALVYREYYYIVDGGRAYMPAPEHRDDRLVVERRSYDLIRMLNELEQMPYRDSYGNYCDRAGFQIV